jgi:hypothetical protein
MANKSQNPQIKKSCQKIKLPEKQMLANFKPLEICVTGQVFKMNTTTQFDFSIIRTPDTLIVETMHLRKN